MDDSQKNLIKIVLTWLGNCLVLLKNGLMAGLIYPFKQVLKESIGFLRTLENIQGLDERMPRNVLPKGTPGSGKNLLACAVSGEAQVLFFNVSGFEFIKLYVGVDVVKVRKYAEQAWNKVEKEDFEPAGDRILAEPEKKDRFLNPDKSAI